MWHSRNSFLCLWEVHRDAFGWSRSQMLSINPGRLQSHYQMRYPAETEYLKSPLFAMMASSNGNIVRVTGHLCGEFTAPGEFPSQRPVTRSFDNFFDLRLNKRLSKQSWDWWFEMPLRQLWRHCNGEIVFSVVLADRIIPVGARPSAGTVKDRCCYADLIFKQQSGKYAIIVVPNYFRTKTYWNNT